MSDSSQYSSDACDRCYRVYSPMIRRFIMKYLGDLHTVEEITQDVFIKLIEKKVPLDAECATTKNFLFTVAKNKMLDHLRRNKYEMERQSNCHIDEVVVDSRFYDDVENLYIEGEVISEFHDTIESLPPIKREIFLRHALQRMPLNQIVEELDVSVFIIKKVDREVRQVLRKRLGKYYGQ